MKNRTGSYFFPAAGEAICNLLTLFWLASLAAEGRGTGALLLEGDAELPEVFPQLFPLARQMATNGDTRRHLS